MRFHLSGSQSLGTVISTEHNYNPDAKKQTADLDCVIYLLEATMGLIPQGHIDLDLLVPHVCMWVYGKSLQLCLTVCDPMDYSLPGSSIHGSSIHELPDFLSDHGVNGSGRWERCCQDFSRPAQSQQGENDRNPQC